jgi:hypothetical protein
LLPSGKNVVAIVDAVEVIIEVKHVYPQNKKIAEWYLINPI